MLIWLILIPVIAAACIGLLKTPGRLTALVSAACTLVLGAYAALAPECSSECLSTFCGTPVQLTMGLPLSRIMVLLSILGGTWVILGGIFLYGKIKKKKQ